MSDQSSSDEILNLICSYSNTWSALEKYDKNQFPSYGTVKEIQLSATQLAKDLQVLKEKEV